MPASRQRCTSWSPPRSSHRRCDFLVHMRANHRHAVMMRNIAATRRPESSGALRRVQADNMPMPVATTEMALGETGESTAAMRVSHWSVEVAVQKLSVPIHGIPQGVFGLHRVRPSLTGCATPGHHLGRRGRRPPVTGPFHAAGHDHAQYVQAACIHHPLKVGPLQGGSRDQQCGLV